MLIYCLHENMIGMWLQKTWKNTARPRRMRRIFFLKK